MKKTKKCYLTALAVVVLVSVYPLYMGVKTLLLYAQNGYIPIGQYPKYVIPYAPLCAALVVVVALVPLLFRLFHKFALLAGSVLGSGLFFALEFALEKAKVQNGIEQMELEAWQYSLCIATPEVLEAVGAPGFVQNNPMYKFHFYLIMVVILLAVLNTAFGFYNMARENSTRKKFPLLAQAVLTAVFIGLCVLACFTAFWRNGTMYIDPLSSICMAVYFIVFGLTAGTFAGTFLYTKPPKISCLVPALCAVAVTVLMYAGELVLTGGELFHFGKGFFFSPLGGIPFAPVDFLIVVLSGALQYAIMDWVRKKQPSPLSC